MRDVVDIYRDVAESMQGMSKDSQIMVTEGLAGKYHITRMQSFLDILSQTNSTYDQIYDASKNSAGSAARENEIYLQSLEARISRARVAVEKLALVLGEKLLNPAAVEGLELFVDALGGIGKVVGDLGALPVLFATVSSGAILLNKNFRELAFTGLTNTVGAFSTVSKTADTTSNKMKSLAVANGFLAASFRGLLAATGVGAVIMGIGWALEFFLNKQAEARQASEQLASQQKMMLDSYSENEKSINSLASEYEELEKVINSGNYNDDQLARFKEVRQELSQLMPNLIVGENSYGDSLIGSAQRVQAQITLAEQQLAIQKQVNAEKEKSAKLDAYEVSKGEYEKLLKEREKFFKEMPANMGIGNEEDFTNKYNDFAQRAESGSLTKGQQETFEFLDRQNALWQELNSQILSAGATMSNATMDYVNNLMSADSSTSAMVDGIVSDFGLLIATSGLAEDQMSSVFEDLVESVKSGDMKQELQSLGVVMEDFDKAKQQYLEGTISAEEYEKYATEANKQLTKIKESLLGIARKELGGTTADEYQNFKSQLDAWIPSIESASQSADKLADSQVKVKSTSEMSTAEVIENAIANSKNAQSMSEAEIAAYAESEGIDEATAATQLNTAAKYENMTSAEMMVGVSQDNIDKNFEMIEVYNVLSSMENTSASQKEQLRIATETLAAAYPNLINGKELDIEAMIKETEANNILLAASKASAEGILDAQQQKSLGTALTTKATIENMKAEIRALETLSASWAAASNAVIAMAQSNPFLGATGAAMAGVAQAAGMRADSYTSELDALQGSLNTSVNILKDIPAVQDEVASGSNRMADTYKKAQEAADASTKATKDSTKALDEHGETIETTVTQYEKFIYVADRYANAQNRLNTSMAKFQMILAKYPKHTDAYKKALQEQLILLQEQRKLINTQHSDTWSQINSGYFRESGILNNGYFTGVETTKTTTSSSGGSGSSAMQGTSKAYVGKYANEINAAATKYGISPALIAGIIDQESDFNPNAKSHAGAMGLMQLMPGTARDLGVSNAYNPSQNVNGGVKHFARLLKKYDGNVANALAAYNWGEGNMDAFLKTGKGAKGQSRPTENKNYVGGVLSKAGAFGYGTTSSTSTTSAASSGSNPYQYGSKGVADYYLNEFRSSNDFGQTRSDGKKHWGIDFNKNGTSGNQDMGTPILNLVSGVVKQVFKNNKTAGNGVVITGDDGKEYRYIHMQSAPNFKVGQKVQSGAKLGGMGNSGSGTYAHLDLKVKDAKGNYLNPMDVLQQYSKNGGSSSPSSSTTSVISNTNPQAQSASDASRMAAEMAQATDEAKQKLLDLTQQLYSVDGEIEDLRHEIIMTAVYQSEYDMEQKDVAVQKFKNETYWMEKTSQVYRENLLDQRKQLLAKQQIIADEEATIRALMNGGVQMSERTRYELQQRLDELHNLKIANAEMRDSVQYEIITSSMAEYQKQVDKTTKSIERLRTARNYLEKDTRAYRDSLSEEAKALSEVNHQLMNQINTMQRQQYYYKMTPEQLAEFTQNLDDLQDQLVSNNNTIEDLQRELADNIIDIAKKGYEQRRDLEIKILEDSLEKEEKIYEEKWELYEKDAQEYEDAIRRKINAIQSQYDEDQYLKGLNKLKEEEQKILKQINVLSLDDSMDAQARRVELDKQLKDVREQIEDETAQHSIDTQVGKLEEELDAYNEKLDEEREADDKRMEELRKNAEEEIKQVNWKYQEILNDEQYWNQMRTDILEGNSNKMQIHLNRLLEGMKNYSTGALKELEISATGMLSLLDELRTAGQNLGLVGDLEGIQNGNTNSSDNFVEKNAAWNKYLSNKRKYDRPETTQAEKQALAKENETLRNQWGFVDGHYSDLEKLDVNNSTTQQTNGGAMNDRLVAWAEYIRNKEAYTKATTTKQQQDLIARNAQLRAQYNFPDAPLNVLKQIDSDHIATATNTDTAKKVQDWYKYLQNKRDYVQAKDTATQLRLQKENATLRSKWSFPDGDLNYLLGLDPTKFHDGGITGSKPNRLGEIFNKLFNTKPNEQVITSLVGELNVPPKNFANGIQNLREVASKLIQPVGIPAGAGDVNIYFQVENMHGTQAEAEGFSTKIKNIMKRNGKY